MNVVGIVSEDKIDTNYWQERMTYNLDETSRYNGAELFNYRYSDVYDGYFVSLTMDAKKLFGEIPRAKVNVTFDLNADYFKGKEMKIVGLDYNAFDGVELDTVTVKGNTQTFYFLENSLLNTDVKTVKRSRDMTLDGLEKATNTEFAEVVL